LILTFDKIIYKIGDGIRIKKRSTIRVTWRYLTGITLCLLTMISILFLSKYRAPNTFYNLSLYGATEEEIAQIARAYGISVDSIASFGTDPFPINYILTQMNWSRPPRNNPTIFRHQIDELVKGYVSKCDLTRSATIYVYYEELDHILKRRSGPVILEVIYELDRQLETPNDDQIVQTISTHGLGDSPRMDWENVIKSCKSQIN